MSDSSLLKHAINSIRGYILEGRIKPGEKLNIDGLARSLNISKTPVREAMNALTADKLVIYRPRIGYAVRTITPEEFLALSQLQEVIETFMYIDVACLPQPIDYSRLEAINEEIKDAVIKKDEMRVFSLNEEFHMAIYRYCSNQKMVERLRELWNELLIHRFHMFSSPFFLQTIPKDHQDILEAMKLGDVEMIRKTVSTHFRNGNIAVVEGLKTGDINP